MYLLVWNLKYYLGKLWKFYQRNYSTNVLEEISEWNAGGISRGTTLGIPGQFYWEIPGKVLNRFTEI